MKGMVLFLDKVNSISFEIKKLTILMKRKMDNAIAEKCPNKPTGVHGFVITYLFQNRDKDVFQKDLEEKFSIRRSTATSILQIMEKNNYITRTPTDYDARLKKLELTDKALEFYQIISEEILKIENTLAKGLTQEEISSFLKVAEKMRKNIENGEK